MAKPGSIDSRAGGVSLSVRPERGARKCEEFVEMLLDDRTHDVEIEDDRVLPREIRGQICRIVGVDFAHSSHAALDDRHLVENDVIHARAHAGGHRR